MRRTEDRAINAHQQRRMETSWGGRTIAATIGRWSAKAIIAPSPRPLKVLERLGGRAPDLTSCFAEAAIRVIADLPEQSQKTQSIKRCPSSPELREPAMPTC